jgi:cyanate permease
MAVNAQPVPGKSKGIFWGWWLVIITGVVSGIGNSFNSYGISVFFKDLTAELGSNRAVTSLATGIGRLEGGIISPLTGWLADRFGPKWLIFAGICIAASGMIMMKFINSISTYFIAWGVLVGFGINFGLTVAVDQAITNWFVRKRGLAMGIKFLLLSIGGVITIPTVTWLVKELGWRTTCLAWGTLLFACAPMILIFVKQKRPEYYGLLPDGVRAGSKGESDKEEIISRGVEYASGIQENEFTFKQALSTRTFWMIAVSYCLFATVSGGFPVHVIPFLTDIGISQITASGMMSMMVFFMIPSRFFSGFGADRIKKGYLQFLLAGAFALLTMGLGIFLMNPRPNLVYILLIPYGLSSGAVTPLVLLILGRYFGRKSFGAIFGTCMMLVGPAQLVAPAFAGWIYDTTGKYIIALTVFAGLAFAAMLIMFFVRAPRLPAIAMIEE